MKTFHRRATPGTNRQNSVPGVAHNSAFTCRYAIDVARNDEKLMCHTWHTSDFTHVKFSNIITAPNVMIVNLIQRCNHRCEVCEIKNHRKIHTNTQGVHHHIIFISRNYYFLKGANKFSALKLRQTLTKTLDN